MMCCRSPSIVSVSGSSGFTFLLVLLRGAVQQKSKKMSTMVAAEQGTHISLLMCLR